MELEDVPQDTITDIKYYDNIVVSSWDKSVKVYKDYKLSDTKLFPNPILQSILQNDKIISGDNFGNIYSDTKIETQCGGITCLHEFMSGILVGGWNGKLCLIQDKVEGYINTGKIVCSDLLDTVLILGLATREVIFYDIRTYKVLKKKSVNFMIRSVKLTRNYYVLGSTCGMIQTTYFDGDEWIFSAHYGVKSQIKTYYPVNSLVIDEYLFSGGSDGNIRMWDLVEKKGRIIHSCGKSITAMSMNKSKNFVVAHSNIYYENSSLPNSIIAFNDIKSVVGTIGDNKYGS